MNTTNLNIQNTFPEGIPATGQFLFNQSTYPNDTFIGDSETNIVGTPTTPYLPMALPAYIPIIYQNIYNIQKNLKNKILTENVSDNREYPTIFAVKEYINSQFECNELLVPVCGVSKLTISTILKTTFLTTSKVSGSPNVAKIISNGITTYITTYNINPINVSKNGAEKICINTSAIGITSANEIKNLQIVLTEPKQSFVVNGKHYKCYVPASLGDILNMVQFIEPSTKNELFFVISYGGLFSDTAYYK